MLLCPMRIPRDPDREGAEDDKAMQAYYRASRWPVFTLARYLVLRELTKLKPFGLLVDAGCGPGFLTAQISRKFPAVKVIGLDISAGTLENARRTCLLDLYPGLDFLVADAQQMPFADNSVDFVISSLSLHHWPDSQVVFQEILRTLKPGSRFFIFDLRRNSPVYVFRALTNRTGTCCPEGYQKY